MRNMEGEPKIESRPEGKIETMTFEEYAEMHHETPHVFTVENGGKQVVYFGTEHSRDPDNPMFGEIEQKFREANPQIVFVEGMGGLEDRKQEAIKKLKERSNEEVIRELGEPGFTLKLAVEASVDMESPEPKFSDEINHLIQGGFSQDEIFAFYMYRQVEQYHRTPKKPELEKYLEPYIDELQRATRWKGFDYSVDHLEEVGKRIWGEKSGLDNAEIAKERIDPVPWPDMRDKQTVVNEIARQSSYHRDRYIVERMKKVMTNKNRLFVIFGASHAVMQEQAIRKLFSDGK